MDSLKIKDILQVQLKEGIFSDYGSRSALASLFNITDTILFNNGYKKPTSEKMQQKMFDFFGFYPPNGDTSISYIRIDNEPPTEDNGDIMDILDEVLVYNSSIYNPIYVSYEHNLITYAYYLPEIFDYERKFPELLELEEKISYWEDPETGEHILIEKWKDVPDLEQQRNSNRLFVIHLNKFLFNDSNSSLTWLINNHMKFIEMALQYYGYDKNERINKAVLTKIQKEYFSNRHADGNILTDLFARKDRYGNLDIRSHLMEYIFNVTTPEDNNYLTLMESYGNMLESTNSEYAQIQKTFTKEERLKIIAYIAYYTQKAYDLHWSKYLQKWNAGSFLYFFITHSDDNANDFLEQVRANNYYNLEGYEKMINSVLEYIENEPVRIFPHLDE